MVGTDPNEDKCAPRGTSSTGTAYLGAADRQTEILVGEDLFLESLLCNVLFEEHFVIPDIFFFISPTIARHILRPRHDTSLLAASIGRGICVPVFREGGSFQEALDVISPRTDKDAAIRGVLRQAPAVAQALDRAIGAFDPQPMPNFEVGERYRLNVINALSNRTDLPEEFASLAWERMPLAQMAGVWRRTDAWRDRVITRAIDRTRAVAGGGLRNGAIAEALGEEFHLDTNDEEFREDPYSVLLARASGTERDDLRVFLRWTRDLYLATQAESYGARLSIPRPHSLGSAFVISSAAARLQVGPDSDQQAEMILTERMPSTRALVALRPSELLSIRMSEGTEYMNAVKQWEAEPTDNSLDELRFRLSAYMRRLAEAAASPLSHRLQVFGGRLEWLGSVASVFGNRTASLSLLTVGGSMSLAYYLGKPRPIRINVTSGEIALQPIHPKLP